MIDRKINSPKDNSFFLFGARGTGKSTWLRDTFKDTDHIYIDLLDPETENRFFKTPSELEAIIAPLDAKKTWVLIDEIQKLPKLLDVVHRCIEKYKIRFVLTGSSARKLKRGAANLLAGRAFTCNLFPLTYLELKEQFNLMDALQWGSLPQIFTYTTSISKVRYLRAYSQTYLKEEIASEQMIRKLVPFRHFLQVSAQMNGEIINYSSIARDVGVDTATVQSYFQILEDTLIGVSLPSYHHSVRKRQRSNPKFYYFDLGVKRSLEGTLDIPATEQTYGFGKAFEHFIILEIWRINHYQETDWKFSYLRTKDHAGIDLIIEKPDRSHILIEIKSSTQITEKDAKTLTQFHKDFKNATSYILSRDPIQKKYGEIIALPWETGIQTVFNLVTP